MTATALAPPAPSGLLSKIKWHWLHNPKIVLWVIWWTIPFFYILFGTAYFAIANTMPPPPATFSAAEVAEWVGARRTGIQLAYVSLYLTFGLPCFHMGLIYILMRRMSVSPIFAYAYLAIMAAATVPGGLFNGFGFSALALRPDRDPEAVMFLYDFANLTFTGSIAILLDKNSILPKWFGYACIWNLTTEFTVSPVWLFRGGEFAWNGGVTFYWNMVIYTVWQVMYCVVFYDAIKKLPMTKTLSESLATPLAST
jgi:hypothetical protein